jgi:hypothetical protein
MKNNDYVNVPASLKNSTENALVPVDKYKMAINAKIVPKDKLLIMVLPAIPFAPSPPLFGTVALVLLAPITPHIGMAPLVSLVPLVNTGMVLLAPIGINSEMSS